MMNRSTELGARIAAVARMAVELHLERANAATAARDELQQQQQAGGTGARAGGAGTGVGGAGTRTLGYDDAPPPCVIDLQAAKLIRLVREVAA